MYRRTVIGFAMLITSLPQLALGLKFEESNHVVSMEAEHATENVGWVEKTGLSGASGVTLEDQGTRGVGHISFEIFFHSTGKFYIWALTAKPANSSDWGNDCFGDFNGNHFQVAGGSSCTGHSAEVIGLGTHQTSLGWQSRPKTECSADRSKHVYFEVNQTGWGTFTLTSRSQGYLMDKLVLQHESVYNGAKPTGSGPAETVDGSGGTTGTPTAILTPADGAELTAGRAYTFTGEGESLSWSYDASSDGLGAIDMGTGASIEYTIPTNVNDPKLFNVTLTGTYGTATRSYQIVDATQPPPVGDADFCEINGVVMMQAENATEVKDWTPVSGACGGAMEDHGDRAGYLRFEIEFTRTGDYYVWMLCANGPNGTESNDCWIRLDGELSYDPTGLRPDGIRQSSTSWQWTSQPKGPGAHTTAVPPIHVKVLSAGVHIFEVGSRSNLFKVDKILLELYAETSPVTAPDCGPEETLCGEVGRPAMQHGTREPRVYAPHASPRRFTIDGRMIRACGRAGRELGGLRPTVTESGLSFLKDQANSLTD
ncbi:MAG: hypothetical protein GF331_26215 [Chitinivibrionales bacterium]|nr:hypothetical protein [Chitinivibrionales bacterium]